MRLATKSLRKKTRQTLCFDCMVTAQDAPPPTNTRYWWSLPSSRSSQGPTRAAHIWPCACKPAALR